MTLIKSISGIRGTIGGKQGEGLSPTDVVKFTIAFGLWISNRSEATKKKIVIGRDARLSGEMVKNLVVGALQSIGIDVIDLGLSTTPTVEIAVTDQNADGGIILTASHNPKQWNALKLLNEKGEFISGDDGAEVLAMADKGDFTFAEINHLGNYFQNETYLHKHIDKILALPLVDANLVAAQNFKVAVDAVNSTGGIYIPALLKALGCEVVELYCEPTGRFPHNPEPLPENLIEISSVVRKNNCDLGVVVDPDVDRLAIVCEDGEMFGEEYTLVLVADYLLRLTPGNTVSNLSSSRALRDVTQELGGKYSASAVGEVNVVEMMKATQAVIGGEGNGGVIYPELHYGRDSLVGVALVLSHLATTGKKMSELRAGYPPYFMAKMKAELNAGIDVDSLLADMAKKYAHEEVNTVDGVKIDFSEGWVHLRKSNTEPIVRVYTEAPTQEKANELGERFLAEIKALLK